MRTLGLSKWLCLCENKRAQARDNDGGHQSPSGSQKSEL